MTQTTARIKKAGKNFEIIVDLDEALRFKKGEISDIEMQGDRIFTDAKKGMAASNSDLEKSFGTLDTGKIVGKIVKEGEVLVSQEYRDEKREEKLKQVIDFLAKNAIDPQTKSPHTPERIKKALEQAQVNIKDIPIEKQIRDILVQIEKIIPIKIEIKKIKLIIPAIYTGKVYGLVNEFKQQENWHSDGNLEIVVNVPSGMIMDFYDKLNSATHGSVISEEIKE